MSDVMSIVVPSLNEEEAVKVLIETAFAQTYRPIEIVFVDGGSSDSTIDIIKNFKDNNKDEQLTVRLLFERDFGEMRSVANARKIGLENASGKFVSFFDADFYFISNDYISRVVDALKTCPWVGSKVKITPETWLENQIMLDNSTGEAGISDHIYLAIQKGVSKGKIINVDLGIYDDKALFEGFGVPLKMIDACCSRHYPHTFREYVVQRRWYGRSSWKYILKYRTMINFYDLAIRPIKEIAALTLAIIASFFNIYIAFIFLLMYAIFVIRIIRTARFLSSNRLAYVLFKTSIGEIFYIYGIVEGAIKYPKLKKNASRG